MKNGPIASTPNPYPGPNYVFPNDFFYFFYYFFIPNGSGVFLTRIIELSFLQIASRELNLNYQIPRLFKSPEVKFMEQQSMDF